MKIGSQYIDNTRCEFVVWAPFLNGVELRIVSLREKLIPMEKDAKGYWRTIVEGKSQELLYFYRLEKKRDMPDPASHFQPQGVHGPSQAIDHRRFKWWDNDWQGITLSDMIIYELHIGTFTAAGTFQAVFPRLSEIKGLGINAIEIMPVSQFPGERNWGYDGVFPFAVQNSYGGPDGLKQLVNECHKNKIAVILDVVYNHLGPEGNYLWDYGPYFTDKYKTPWGCAINFDDAFSNDVRNFFIDNALHWFQNYHIDALRLDAIHGISDLSARPFLQELAEKVKELSAKKGRDFYLIAESDLNDSRVIRPIESGGFGIDAQWCDDFHHSLHTLLTREKDGYYIDFGKIGHLVKAFQEGLVYSGQYSRYRKRNHGNSSKDIPPGNFVVFSQNHDQIGNRVMGERLSGLVSFESLKLAAGAVLLSPYIPLLFMGEEYGEDAPFLYFVSHSDQDLIEAVSKGRKEEFKAFQRKGIPPNPQDRKTFQRSKIAWGKRKKGKHKVLLELYRTMIQLRKSIPALSHPDRACLHVDWSEKKKVLLMRRWKGTSNVYIILNFNDDDVRFTASLNRTAWKKFLDTSEVGWKGPGTLLTDWVTGGKEITVRKRSLALYVREDVR
jgi:maltooligosyltrehalose trehalohydrolase